METSTASSTAVTSNYAGFGNRLVAWIIDIIVIGILHSIIISPILAAIGFGIASEAQNVADGSVTEAEAIGLVASIAAMAAGVWLVVCIIDILYYALMESSKYQATLGKMALGIKVTDMNGERISFGKALLRAVGRILSQIIMFIGYIIAAFTEKKQALHDMIAGTLVLKK